MINVGAQKNVIKNILIWDPKKIYLEYFTTPSPFSQARKNFIVVYRHIGTGGRLKTHEVEINILLFIFVWLLFSQGQFVSLI